MRTILARLWMRIIDDPAWPVVVLEMRTLMRGIRAPLALFISTLLAAGVASFVLFTSWHTHDALYSPDGMVLLSRRFLMSVTLLETVVVLVLAPAFALGMIWREYHRQTMEGLLLTGMTPRQIIRGKMLAVTGLLAVGLLSAVPVQAIVFLMGGVSPWEVAWAVCMLLLLAACLATVGLFCAVRVPHPVGASLATVGLGLLALLSPILLLPLPLTIAPAHRRRNWRRKYAQQVLWSWLKMLGGAILLIIIVALLGALGPASALYTILNIPLLRSAEPISSGGLYWWVSFFACVALLISIYWMINNAAVAIHQRQFSASDRFIPDTEEPHAPDRLLPEPLRQINAARHDPDPRRRW